MSLPNLTIAVIFALIILLIPVSTVFAHRMVIEEVEDGLVWAGYEDGRFSRRTEVVVYDEQGEELARGSLDSDGNFAFPPEQAALIVADDGLGHRAEYNLGLEARTEPPRGPTIALVCSGFLIIAGVFHYRTQKFSKGS
jgi:nickel transport protein